MTLSLLKTLNFKKLFALGLISAFALSLSTTSLSAEARHGHHNINQRQKKQSHRIHSGAKNDSLTKYETKRLAREQKQIHRMEHRFKSDGEFTKRERARVQHQQNKQSANIYRLKHNERTQP